MPLEQAEIYIRGENGRMAKGPNQKAKLLYLIRLLEEQTDDKHGISMSEILSYLEAHGVAAERKSIYDDMEVLRNNGLDIIALSGGREHRYALASRDFDLAELKMLVDTVQSAKFLSEDMSRNLIKKLEKLTSHHEARQLHREVVITGRVKAADHTIFYSVDAIQGAISDNHQIRFQYWQWNEKKERVQRHNGKWYQVSPWSLIWDDENYYMVAYDAGDMKLKHFRVDKMSSVRDVNESRQGKEVFESRDTAAYTRQRFGMFDGELCKVTLQLKNSLAGVFIDHFGSDIMLIPAGDGKCRTTVEVAVSNQFLGWVMSLEPDVQVVSPDFVVEQMKEKIAAQAKQYGMQLQPQSTPEGDGQ